MRRVPQVKRSGSQMRKRSVRGQHSQKDQDALSLEG